MSRTARQIRQVALDLGVEGAEHIKTVQRTRSGHWQRSQGAWSWWASGENGAAEYCGSVWPAWQVVQAHRQGRVTTYYAPNSTTPELQVTPVRAS